MTLEVSFEALSTIQRARASEYLRTPIDPGGK
jgi:hypothetical protein